jgi:GT2 family glycosyltransferase
LDKRKSVSVIIPNFNGQQLLKEYLPFTLAAVKNIDFPYEIIVVDDCSTDNSVAFLKSEYPEIILVVNPENKGFSYTCNRGIEIATCQLILLLNTDVKLSPDYFEHQWKYFMRWDTFGVMGRITDMSGEKIQDAARLPKWNWFKLKTEYFYYTKAQSDRLYTLYLSGANALIDAEKLKELGGFNELFSPFYCEDMELCMRAWLLKWNCYYEHNSVCCHMVSASTKKYARAKEVKSIYFRNRLYFHAIHLNNLALIGWFLQVTLFDLLPRLITGQIWFLKSYLNLFSNSKAIKQSRNKVKALIDDYESDINIFSVVSKIRISSRNKRYIRFRP